MSWENSGTDDVLFGARKLVLTVADGMADLMDVMDPAQCLRYGVDREGNPVERDPDVMTTLDFLALWEPKLRRANSALHEVAARVRDMEVANAEPTE